MLPYSALKHYGMCLNDAIDALQLQLFNHSLEIIFQSHLASFDRVCALTLSDLSCSPAQQQSILVEPKYSTDSNVIAI